MEAVARRFDVSQRAVRQIVRAEEAKAQARIDDNFRAELQQIADDVVQTYKDNLAILESLKQRAISKLVELEKGGQTTSKAAVSLAKSIITDLKDTIWRQASAGKTLFEALARGGITASAPASFANDSSPTNLFIAFIKNECAGLTPDQITGKLLQSQGDMAQYLREKGKEDTSIIDAEVIEDNNLEEKSDG